MKNVTLLVITLLLTLGVTHAQSSITSLTVYPANPTTSGTVYVYAELLFPNSDCLLDNKHVAVIDNDIMASTQHCMGMLTAICNTTDTFKIAPLLPGTYTFALVLSSGMGSVPCTPGIIADDNDSISFVVSGPTGIEEIPQQAVRIFPNPVREVLTIGETAHNIQQLVITAVHGAVIMKSAKPQKALDVSTLPRGIYLLEVYHDKGVEVLRFLKE